jgi:quaternary ammonium compound-resistance protein SugE
MAWLFVFVAGLLEIVFAVSLKNSEGFTRPGWVALFLLSAAASLFLLSQALKVLPVGVTYATWTGIGAAGTAVVGMLVLGESKDLLKIVSLLVVIAGIAGLQLSTSTQH